MRKAKDYEIRSKTARQKIAPRRKPYYRQLRRGLTLGYVRTTMQPGRWVARLLVDSRLERYKTKVLGDADDVVPADGASVLAYEQAVVKAQEFATTGAYGGNGRFAVKRAVDEYVAHLRAVGKASAADAEQRLRKHVLGYAPSHAHTFSDTDVRELTTAALKAWMASMVKEDENDPEVERRSRDSANRVLNYFKAALNLAFEEERNEISSDTAWRRLKPFKNVSKSREHYFGDSQAKRLISAARKHEPAFGNLITAGFLVGARYGELANLNVEHFDGKRGILQVPDGKTGARPVALQREAVAFFRRLAKGRKNESPLLPRPDGGRWGKSHQFRPMNTALAAAKLPAGASFYALRHSYATAQIERGTSIQILADNMGTSVAMIAKTYAKVLAGKRRHHIEAGSMRLALRKSVA